jgi:predicted CXXCH cytochrome family protein
MNMGKMLAVLAVLAASALPVAALAAGGHDSIGCTGCHSLHKAKGDLIFAVAPNTKYLNPKTKQPYSGATALCLACHSETDKGGQGYAPVSQHNSHPFGLASVNPKVARVPPELLRDGGRFDCLGCHDPHPSNQNYSYLRVNVGKKGENMDVFCAACHSSKSDASAQVTIFTSMDETRALVPPPPPASPKAPSGSDKPAGKK